MKKKWISVISVLLAAFLIFLYRPQASNSCASQNAAYVFGLPLSQNKVLCLNQKGFVIGYSDVYKNPLWVAYRVRGKNLYKNYNRYRFFSADKRTHSRVEYYDYSGSGYTRGHLAPASTLYYSFGEDAMRETFLMSNIVPQKYAINAGVWATLEQKERNLAQKIGQEILVISGPIFDNHKESLQKCSRKYKTCRDTGIEIPDQFYKIILFPDIKSKNISNKTSPKALAFIVDHRSQERDLRKFLVSIDRIEELVKINFFPQLDTQKNNVSAATNPNSPSFEKALESAANYKDFSFFLN